MAKITREAIEDNLINEVNLNTAKVGITTQQASDITTNNAKVSADGPVTTHSDVTDAGSGLIITDAERTTLGTAEQTANKGQANGYASLNGSGLVPTSQLPSYVDDVLEYADEASFPGTGEAGKIYVDIATGKIFRWTGSVYVEISPDAGAPVASVNGETGTVVLTTGDIAEDTNKNYVTDADLTTLSNTSGVNTGDQDLSGYVETTDIDTLAELNAIVTDATLIDTADPRLSDARTPLAHTHTASEVTDFESAVTANVSVTANTAKISYPTIDSTKVGHISVTQPVDLDTLESDTTANTAKVGITTQQANDIIANNAKVSNVDHPLVETAVPIGAVFTDTDYSSVNVNIITPSAYLGDEDDNCNVVVDYNATSNWESGDYVELFVSGADLVDFDNAATYLFVGNTQYSVDNADFTPTSIGGGVLLTTTSKIGTFGINYPYNLTSSIEVVITAFHKDSGGATKTSEAFSRTLIETRGNANKFSAITAPVPFNTLVKAPILTEAQRDAALLTDVSTDHGKLIYNNDTKFLEYWDGTIFRPTNSRNPILTKIPYWQYITPNEVDAVKCGVRINIRSEVDEQVTFSMLISAPSSQFVNRALIPAGWNDIKDIPYFFIDDTSPELTIGATNSSLISITLTLNTNEDYCIGVQGDGAASIGGFGATFQVSVDDDLASSTAIAYQFTDGENYIQPFTYEDTTIQAEVDLNTAKIGVTTELKPADIDTLAELNAIVTDATLIDTTDSRLSDARTPTAHTHVAADVTDFDTEVSNNASVTANTAKSADGKFVDGTDPLDAVYLDGNVGVGTTDPLSGIHLKIDGEGSPAKIITENTNVVGGAEFEMIEAGGGNWKFKCTGGNAGFKIRDHGAAADRMFISNTGDVGIGNNTPAAKLDVVGDIKVSGEIIGMPIVYSFAVGGEIADITTGAAKVTLRMPYAMTLTSIRASATTAPVGSTIILDVNLGGTSIFTTNLLSIDDGEKTSTTAATAANITTTALTDDGEITVDIDQIGSTTAGTGIKIYLIGTRA